MDSVLHGEREQFQTGRRMSQDISTLHAALAARAGRHNLFSKGRPAALQVPEVIAEEGHSQPQPPELDSNYDVYQRDLREMLSSTRDAHGKPLYTNQQIQAQLEESQVCPIDHYDRSFGETGGIVCFGRGALGVEHSHLEVAVSSLTMNDKGYKEMDEKWADVSDGSEASFRWIHLPANNMEWARHAIGQILSHYLTPADEDDPVSAVISPSALEDQILRTELWEGQQNVGAPELPHARFMRPFCHKIDASVTLSQSKLGRTLSRHDSIWSSSSLENPIQTALGKSMVLFMPFIHWETTLAYLHMKAVITDVDAGGIGVFGSPDIAGLPCGIDEKLLRHYLQRLQPVHIRRTLDQFGYYTIADTTSRDKDQVVDRYSRAHHITDHTIPPMLMVDQCWLWILGNNTVLTCFPHRWNRSSQSDSTDIYEGILELLDDPLHRTKVQNSGQLATLIIDRCAGNVLDRTLIKDEHLRFLDFFDWSIDDLNERQSQCLQALWQDVQNSRHDGDADGLTDISKEFDVLEKIKDIIDELQIVLRLIDQQQLAFTMVLHDEASKQASIFDNKSDGAATPATHLHGTSAKLTEYVDFSRLQENIHERAESVKAMIDRANATYNATLDVLSLKQQQANISEARSSRKAAQEMEKMAKEAKKSAEETEKQSYSIMLFTVVTIFFLPMSSIAGLFGVNAVEFGQGTIHLSTIMAYVFPISILVVYLSFFLAFNHKARRQILMCMQICRAYINLAMPVVFDDQKESKLAKKLQELKEKQHARRVAKSVKLKAKQEAEEAALQKANTNTTDDNAGEEEKDESVYSAPDFVALQRERSRFNSVATMGVFGWRGNKGKDIQDAEVGRPVPSRMSSYNGLTAAATSRRPMAVS